MAKRKSTSKNSQESSASPIDRDRGPVWLVFSPPWVVQEMADYFEEKFGYPPDGMHTANTSFGPYLWVGPVKKELKEK